MKCTRAHSFRLPSCHHYNCWLFPTFLSICSEPDDINDIICVNQPLPPSAQPKLIITPDVMNGAPITDLIKLGRPPVHSWTIETDFWTGELLSAVISVVYRETFVKSALLEMQQKRQIRENESLEKWQMLCLTLKFTRPEDNCKYTYNTCKDLLGLRLDREIQLQNDTLSRSELQFRRDRWISLLATHQNQSYRLPAWTHTGI